MLRSGSLLQVLSRTIYNHQRGGSYKNDLKRWWSPTGRFFSTRPKVAEFLGLTHPKKLAAVVPRVPRDLKPAQHTSHRADTQLLGASTRKFSTASAYRSMDTTSHREPTGADQNSARGLRRPEMNVDDYLNMTSAKFKSMRC